MTSDPDCIFCKIIAGRIPSTKLYEDSETLAFMDINPVHDGHCLVIPKAHYPTIFELPPASFAAIGRVAIRLARAVDVAVKPDGLNLLQANGPGAAQSVAHFHLHILPRRLGDELPMNWGVTPGVPARIAEIAARIRAQL